MVKEKGLPVRYFLYVLFKHKQMILILFFSIVLTVIVGNLLMKPVYEATGKILLERQSDDEKALLFRMNLNPDYSRYNWVNAEVEILQSRPVIIRVIKDVGLMKEMAARSAATRNDSLLIAQAVESFRGSLRLETTKDAPVITIKFDHQNPEIAARVVSSLIQNYKNYRHNIFVNDTKYQFLQAQLAETEKELRQLQNEAVDFKVKSGLALPQEYGKILYAKLGDFEKQLTLVHANRIALEAQVALLKQQIARGQMISLPEWKGENKSAEVDYLMQLRNRLLDLQLQREKLLEKYTPEYQEVQHLNTEISVLNGKLKEAVNQYLLGVQSKLESLALQEEVLKENISEIRRQIRQFVVQENKIAQLKQGIGEKQEIYSVLRKQQEEARISLAKMEGGVDVRIISPPSVPVSPVRPRRKLNVLLSIVVALFVSLGASFASEYFSRTFSSVEEVEAALGVPVLASIHEYHEQNKFLPAGTREPEDE